MPATECKRAFYGATYLFDAIGEKLGITADLKICFPESYNQIEFLDGYFALLSNDVKDSLEAPETYRSKDLIEKTFGNLKERLNMHRTSVSSEENLEGKLFVQFVALIYLAYIDRAMREKGLCKDYTLQEMLDKLDVIECFQQPGSRHHVGETTKKQMELYRCMDVELPP